MGNVKNMKKVKLNKIGILLGIKKRFVFRTQEVMVLNKDGQPIDSYIERKEFDLLKNKYTDCKF